ncbi:MAG: UDP-N-acetylmuramoyl-L-alanyl-D-glutamate--2,6-diaminopimelate ligase [Microthrixaceae bacterium]
MAEVPRRDEPTDAGPASARAGLSLVDAATAVDGRLVPYEPGRLTLTEVSCDSRDAMAPGTIFAAVPGSVTDGHRFVEAAVAAGASAVMVERAQEGLEVPQLVVADVRAAVGPLAQAVAGHPAQSLQLIGVTGTNGKTTFVTLLAALLGRLGVRAEAFGTLTGARTTPEGPDLARQLRAAADTGVQAVAMEVSSHALALHRVDGLVFDLVVFTNLGRDHLDFHATQEEYFAAKARLFEPERARHGLLCVDDVHGRLLADAAGALPVSAYSVEDLDEVSLSATGSRFSWRGHTVSVAVAGRFNLANVLAALEAAVLLGHPAEAVARAADGLEGPPGRFQVVEAAPGEDAAPAVIVDYAHSPDALAGALDSARELVGDGHLTVVFGCGGDRDRAKRPAMGRVAAERADRVIITSDNPRNEDPLAIAESVAQGSAEVSPTPPEIELDRRRAIRTALASAADGSLVLVAGKGHETTQTFADRVEPFDDAVVVAEERAHLSGPAAGEDRA